MAFFAAGARHQERCMMAANRIGKTFGLGGYETTLHLTGLYPDWWQGYRFAQPIETWAASNTAETTRDIVQAALMGPIGELGTGLIPGDAILGEPSKRSGVTGAFDTARIRHVCGGASLLGFKSFDQGRRRFQGTAKHVIWLDEEPPADVYDECMMRVMTTDGLMLCTFTPLLGLTEIALRFMPQLALPKATPA
jgi:phage terminase large subunit-like protein